ncbi:hypothetical protein J7359_09485 [Paracoccus sp. R12_2]|uniref:hypothetical protein n=1 Tax=Paracoccus sp. R12_2 TaxID=2821098 RepID=UPI001ADC93B7|nr:hypothetical protein [Paracoccus sp. R12_2]MBO9455436.1 hypothetical protein [Paracoccus sp. R12_2]
MAGTTVTGIGRKAPNDSHFTGLMQPEGIIRRFRPVLPRRGETDIVLGFSKQIS